jgi:hypothetical protein
MINVIFVFCEVVLHYEFQVFDSITAIPVEVPFLDCYLYANSFSEAATSLN